MYSDNTALGHATANAAELRSLLEGARAPHETRVEMKPRTLPVGQRMSVGDGTALAEELLGAAVWCRHSIPERPPIVSILLFLVFGFVVGLIARAVMPGTQSMSIPATTAVGVVGSLIGGFVSTLAFGGRWNEIHAAGLIGSVVGALAIMGIVSFMATRPQTI